MYKKYFVILHLPNNKGVRQTMRKYLKWLLPVIFIAYYSCITLFIHVHIEHGTTIVHSHPYKPGTEHEHTTAEFQLIHMLSSIETENPSMWAFVSVILFSYCSRLFFPSRYFCLISEKWGAHGLRAPPVSVL